MFSDEVTVNNLTSHEPLSLPVRPWNSHLSSLVLIFTRHAGVFLNGQGIVKCCCLLCISKSAGPYELSRSCRSSFSPHMIFLTGYEGLNFQLKIQISRSSVTQCTDEIQRKQSGIKRPSLQIFERIYHSQKASCSDHILC
jgi:hypothetical protein